jgi:hypothetical protein
VRACDHWAGTLTRAACCDGRSLPAHTPWQRQPLARPPF